MKQPSKLLHRLVHKLDKAEQKQVTDFIKLHTSPSDGKIMLDFFVAVMRQQVYDEGLLRTQLNHTLNNNSFKTCKFKLKELILDCLRAQRNTHTQSMDYRRMQDHIELLMAKGLYGEALSSIRHLQKMITPDFQQRNRLVFIETMELEHLALNYYCCGESARKEKISKTVHHHSDKLLKHYQYRLLISRLSKMASCTLRLNKAQDINELEELKNSDTYVKLGQQNPNYIFAMQQVFYVSLLEADFEKHLDYAVHTWNGYHQPATMHQMRTEHLHDYGDSFVNLVRACILAKDKNILIATFESAIPAYPQLLTDSDYYRSFLQYCIVMLCYFDNHREGLQHQAQVLETRDCPSEPETDMLRYRLFYTTLAVIHHRLGNYKAALSHCYKVLSTNRNNLTEIHYCDFCNIFRFIIEYDMLSAKKEYQLCDPVAFDPAHNKLKREHGLSEGKLNHSFELCILSYLSNPSAEACNLCLAELSLLRHTTTALHFNALFNFEAWINKQA